MSYYRPMDAENPVGRQRAQVKGLLSEVERLRAQDADTRMNMAEVIVQLDEARGQVEKVRELIAKAERGTGSFRSVPVGLLIRALDES